MARIGAGADTSDDDPTDPSGGSDEVVPDPGLQARAAALRAQAEVLREEEQGAATSSPVTSPTATGDITELERAASKAKEQARTERNGEETVSTPISSPAPSPDSGGSSTATDPTGGAEQAARKARSEKRKQTSGQGGDGLTDAQQQNVNAALAETSDQAKRAQQGIEGTRSVAGERATDWERAILEENPELTAADVAIRERDGELQPELTASGRERLGANPTLRERTPRASESPSFGTDTLGTTGTRQQRLGATTRRASESASFGTDTLGTTESRARGRDTGAATTSAVDELEGKADPVTESMLQDLHAGSGSAGVDGMGSRIEDDLGLTASDTFSTGRAADVTGDDEVPGISDEELESQLVSGTERRATASDVFSRGTRAAPANEAPSQRVDIGDMELTLNVGERTSVASAQDVFSTGQRTRVERTGETERLEEMFNRRSADHQAAFESVSERAAFTEADRRMFQASDRSAMFPSSEGADIAEQLGAAVDEATVTESDRALNLASERGDVGTGDAETPLLGSIATTAAAVPEREASAPGDPLATGAFRGLGDLTDAFGLAGDVKEGAEAGGFLAGGLEGGDLETRTDILAGQGAVVGQDIEAATGENPLRVTTTVVGGTAAGTGAVRAAGSASRVARSLGVRRRADASVDLEEITSEAGARGELPQFETDTSAPTSEAVSEVRRRAADNPEAVTEAVGTEGALFHSTEAELPEELTVARGQSELPGLFTAPDASPLRLTEGERSSSGGFRLPRPSDFTGESDRLAAFEGDRIEGMPAGATGSGRIRDPEGEGYLPDPETSGAQFLEGEADPGTAYVRPTGSRTSELEAIFRPESEFEQAGTLAVNMPSGRAVPMDVFRRGDVDDAAAGASRADVDDVGRVSMREFSERRRRSRIDDDSPVSPGASGSGTASGTESAETVGFSSDATATALGADPASGLGELSFDESRLDEDMASSLGSGSSGAGSSGGLFSSSFGGGSSGGLGSSGGGGGSDSEFSFGGSFPGSSPFPGSSSSSGSPGGGGGGGSGLFGSPFGEAGDEPANRRTDWEDELNKMEVKGEGLLVDEWELFGSGIADVDELLGEGFGSVEKELSFR